MRRAVRSVLILVASSMILIGALFIGLDCLKLHVGKERVGWWHWPVNCILILAGGALVAVSRSLAESLTDDFED